jgi:hypothetical protein
MLQPTHQPTNQPTNQPTFDARTLRVLSLRVRACVPPACCPRARRGGASAQGWEAKEGDEHLTTLLRSLLIGLMGRYACQVTAL